MTFPEGLLGPRIEEYFLEVLDQDENLLGLADGWSAGEVTGNYDAVIRSGLKFNLRQMDTTMPPWWDWSLLRFRPSVRANLHSWPYGIYLPSSVEKVVTDDGVTFNVSALDKLSILDSDAVAATYTVGKNSLVTDAVASVIRESGETSILVTDSDKTTTDLMVWPAGTTRLKIVNDLLDVINYDHLWVDFYGRYRAEPYVDLARVPAVHDFVRGDLAVHSPEYSVTQDVLTVPNRVICITTGSGDTPALVSVAENHKADSPYSIEARGGRIISKTYAGVEAADQATLDRIASRNLWNSSTPPEYITGTHAALPIALRDVVTLTDQGGENGTRAWVNEFSHKLDEGAQTAFKWLVVGGEEMADG